MNRSVRARPPLLRALGQNDPPSAVEIGGRLYKRVEIFKHDSWAATARYRGAGTDAVCKFNRIEPVLGMPMAWLGRFLAEREAFALRRLAGVPGIPAELGHVSSDGRRLENAVAHQYVPGHPLASHEKPGRGFFPALLLLLQQVHRRGMAYVDLHKRENILVGQDGKPYLIDFQVCFGLWTSHSAGVPALQMALRALQTTDLYHLAKHVHNHCPEQTNVLGLIEAHRPWWISAHRTIAVPFRQARRAFLSIIGVRGKSGASTTEKFPEDAVRRELERKAA